MYWYALSCRAFWYGGAAWSNEFLSDESEESRLFIPVGMFFKVIGGWLLSFLVDVLKCGIRFGVGFYDDITNDERDIIIHAKNSLLSHKQISWQKKGPTTFDVTMGSYDGAETCELVGSFLLSQLQKKLGQNIGLYRDDGLAITDATPKATENIKKDMPHLQRQRTTNHY